MANASHNFTFWNLGDKGAKNLDNTFVIIKAFRPLLTLKIRLTVTRHVRVNIKVFQVKNVLKLALFEPVFHKTTTQFQVYFFKSLI